MNNIQDKIHELFNYYKKNLYLKAAELSIEIRSNPKYSSLDKDVRGELNCVIGIMEITGHGFTKDINNGLKYLKGGISFLNPGPKRDYYNKILKEYEAKKFEENTTFQRSSKLSSNYEPNLEYPEISPNVPMIPVNEYGNPMTNTTSFNEPDDYPMLGGRKRKSKSCKNKTTKGKSKLAKRKSKTHKRKH